MHPKTLEHFLSRDTANAYGVEHHRLRNTLQEVAIGSRALYALYTPTLLEASRFRAELAAALSQSQEHQAPTATLWSHFLKGRVVVFEFWSSLCTAFGALFGIAGGLIVLATQLNRQSASALTIFLCAVLSVSVVFVGVKFFIDRKALWFKFIISHLDAI